MVNILWRYHPGDNMKWASHDYDDSNWELVEPNLNMLNPDAGKWQGIGWFRKVIKIDSSLVNKFVGVYLHHDGASEIFPKW